MTRSRSSPEGQGEYGEASGHGEERAHQAEVYWTATPERAGPTTPPAPALATVPPSPEAGPVRLRPARPSPAVQITAKPIPNPSRATSKNGNEQAIACANVAADIAPAAQSVSLRAPNRSERAPAGTRDGEGGEPGRAEHHTLLDAGQAEPVGIDGKDRHDRVLGGGTGQDEPVDEEAEQPHRAGAAGGHLADARFSSRSAPAFCSSGSVRGLVSCRPRPAPEPQPSFPGHRALLLAH